jgi:outer membrane murein-binding lipoprotein Lpp
MGPLDAAQKALVYGLAVALGVSVLANVGLYLWQSNTQARLDTCSGDRATLEARVNVQNDEVAKWKTNADAAFELAAKARKEAGALSKAAAPVADALQARIVAGTGKTCDDALREIRRPAGAASAPVELAPDRKP